MFQRAASAAFFIFRTIPICFVHHGDAGWSSPVARQAHNLKVVGSNPTPATNKRPGLVPGFLLSDKPNMPFILLSPSPREYETFMSNLPENPTLDELRIALAPLVARNAAFDGWRPAAVELAATRLGVDAGEAQLAFADGALAMIDAWFASVDAAMLGKCPPDALNAMKIRERITALIQARLDILAPDRESLRRALAILAMPQNAAQAAKLSWRSADAIWRAAGDTATDYNHYTKRSILAAIYAATIMVFLNDESEDLADTRAFLARRIDGIMRFEKAKSAMLARRENRPSLTRFLGRLRYPAY